MQIGLAVGDIEAVQRNARLKRLAMQVSELGLNAILYTPPNNLDISGIYVAVVIKHFVTFLFVGGITY